MKMLVTGGTGVLGRAVVAQALERGHDVRVLTRRHEVELPAGAEVVTGDVLEPGSLANAVAGIEVVIHCSTDPRGNAYGVEVDGTNNLLAACSAADVSHIVYVSIVGVDRIPLVYYRAKLDAEAAVEAGPVPWTILRATQFHNLIVGALTMASKRLPVLPVPKGFSFQVLDPSDCARRLVELAEGEPQGRVPDIGGPEVRRIEDLARSYATITGTTKRVIRLPTYGKKARAFKAGGNLSPDSAYGTVTFETFLERRAAKAAEEEE